MRTKGAKAGTQVRHTENFLLFLSHISLMLKRQQILRKLHGDDIYGVDRAIATGKANTIDLILDIGNAYLEGEKWPSVMRDTLERKLDGGHYFNDKGGKG